MHKRHFLAAAAGLLMTGTAMAQDANGPITIVVPFAAGGATDAAARHIAPKLAKELGRAVIIENKAGASGQLGSAFVKAAPADGSIYLLALDHSVVVVPLITPSLERLRPVGRLPAVTDHVCQPEPPRSSMVSV